MEHVAIFGMLVTLGGGLILANAGFVRTIFGLTVLLKSFLVFLTALIIGAILFNSLFDPLFLGIAVLVVLGAGLERTSVGGLLIGLAAWCLLVYWPVSQSLSPEGWLARLGFQDFAGGLLVHGITGASGLGLCIVKGRRLEFFNLRKSGNLGLFGLGLILIFFGWLGFNLTGLDQLTRLETHLALRNTLLGGATGFLTWSLLQVIHPPQRLSIKGGGFGMIAGLVAVTPCAGWVVSQVAVGLAVLSVVAGFYFSLFVEKALRWDDEFKVFSSHFIPSLIGSMGLGIFGLPPIKSIGVFLWAPLLSGAYAFFVSILIFKLVDKFWGLIVPKDWEQNGSDLPLLGESLSES